MKRTMRGLAFFQVLLLLGLGVLSTNSRATPPNLVFPNVIGFWSGEFSSVSGLGGLASLQVTDQDRRRFEGTFVFYPPQPIVPPNPCFVRGTVSRSGEIRMVGGNPEFVVHIHGDVGQAFQPAL